MTTPANEPRGPVMMTLGPHRFRALGFGFESLSRELNTEWTEVAVVGAFDRLQWTGPKSVGLTIEGAFFPREFGGTKVFEGIRYSAYKGEKLTLIIRDGRVLGDYVITSISEERKFYDAGPRLITYSISLRTSDPVMTPEQIDETVAELAVNADNVPNQTG